VFVFLAEGFEEIEALTAVDILRRAGVDCKTVSIGQSLMVAGAHGIPVKADMLFENQAGLKAADMLILPGGMPGTKNLAMHEGLCGLLAEAFRDGRYIAAICAAPSILGRLGILSGKTAVCFPGYEKELAGATIGSDSVVQDGTVITSKGAGTVFDFALKLAEILKGAAVSQKLKKDMQYDTL